MPSLMINSSMLFVFEPVVAADVPMLKRFMAEVIAGSISREGPIYSEMVENVFGNLDWWLKNAEQCVHLKATAKDTIVGVVLVKHFWNLCSLFVAPSLHRQGIGRALMQMAIKECAGKSPKDAIWLNAAPNAVAFYAGLGFLPRPSTQALPPGFVPMGLAL